MLASNDTNRCSHQRETDRLPVGRPRRSKPVYAAAFAEGKRRYADMTEHDPEHIPTDDELDVEGPNEGATGAVDLDDEDLTDLEDDDGYSDEDDDY
jgi:hypothetical protein